MRSGFTLIEVLLSVALMSVITVIALPLYQSFQVKNDLDIATSTITQSFRRAQMLAMNMDGDSEWGVTITNGAVTIFKGASYAARDVNYDEVNAISSTITNSGISEIVFAKLTGSPSVTGSTVLTSSINTTETRSISLNTKGMVSF